MARKVRGWRDPHLERAAVAAQLVLDDDRQAEGLLEGLGQAASYLSPFSLVVADPLTRGSRAS